MKLNQKTRELLAEYQKKYFLHQGIVKSLDSSGDDIFYFYYGFKNALGKDSIIASSTPDVPEDHRKIILMDESVIIKKDGETIQEGANMIHDIIPSYEGTLGDIMPLLSKDAIIRAIEGPCVDKNELYNDIRNKFLEYMDFGGNNDIADVLTCWTIATHCYTLFDWFPHIFFNAPRESGKTKCAKLVLGMSFGGYDIGASAGATPAQVFRTIDLNRGTIMLDEFEQEFDKKLASEAQKLINQMFNASCDQDSFIIRNDKTPDGKSWLPRKFNIFCPKICCNITGLNDVSLTRYIAFSWLKTMSEKGRKKINKTTKLEMSLIRDRCQVLMLDRWHEIQDIYDVIKIPANCRQEDNWKSVLTVARFISQESEEACLRYMNNYKDVIIESTDTARDFFVALMESLPEGKIKIYAKDIACYPMVYNVISWLQSPAHWVGKKMKEYKIKASRDCAGSYFFIGKGDIKSIVDKYWGENIDNVESVDDVVTKERVGDGSNYTNRDNNYTTLHFYKTTQTTQTTLNNNKESQQVPAESASGGGLLTLKEIFTLADVQFAFNFSPNEADEWIKNNCEKGIIMEIRPGYYKKV